MEQLEAVKKMTDENQHTEARIYIAEAYGLTDFVKLFNAIDCIHGITGYLPPELITLRDKFTNRMMQIISKEVSETVAEEINAAL